MEFFAVLLILIVMLLIIGINSVTIGIGVLFLMELFSVLMILFFVLALFTFFFFKRRKAGFARIHTSDRGIHFAVYEFEGEEYQNIFPVDTLFMNRFYRDGRVSTVFLKRGKKHHYLFDWYSGLVIGLGLLTSVTLTVGIGWFLIELIEFS